MHLKRAMSLALRVIAVVICLAGGTAWALDSGQPPGGNFDLSHWKPQLPTDGGLLTCTNLGVDEFTPAELEAGTNNAYFYRVRWRDGVLGPGQRREDE